MSEIRLGMKIKYVMGRKNYTGVVIGFVNPRFGNKLVKIQRDKFKHPIIVHPNLIEVHGGLNG